MNLDEHLIGFLIGSLLKAYMGTLEKTTRRHIERVIESLLISIAQEVKEDLRNFYEKFLTGLIESGADFEWLVRFSTFLPGKPKLKVVKKVLKKDNPAFYTQGGKIIGLNKSGELLVELMIEIVKRESRKRKLQS